MENQMIKEQNKKFSLVPYTEQRFADPDIYDRGEGIYIYDIDGNKYMDLASQYVNVNVGFGNEVIIQAAIAQMKKLHYCRPEDGTEIRGKLCEKIITEIAPPNMKKIFMTLGGSDANDSAVRIAKAVTGKRKILSQYHSYHGATIGAANLCGDDERHHERLEYSDYIHFEGYNSKKLEKYFDDKEKYCDFLLELLEEKILLEDPNSIAAVFFETISVSELAIPPQRYYEGVRKLCDTYGILLIFDEVLVGFGRTGKWFACEHYKVWPDIMTFAKGITSSYMPLGGVMVSEKVAERLEHIPFSIALTASFHPVSCAAGYATVNYMQRENIIKNAETIGRYLKGQLEKNILSHSYVEEIRGLGLLQSVIFKGKMNTYSAALAFCDLLKENGYFTWSAGAAILIAPPLIITKEEVDKFVEDFKNILELLENKSYIDKLEYYPKESYFGTRRFFSLSYVESMANVSEPYQNILVLGSASLLMVRIVAASVKAIGKTYHIYLSQRMYDGLTPEEREKSIFFDHDRFILDRLIDQVCRMQNENQYDCIFMPYSREDQDWGNIYEVAEKFGVPIYLVSRDGNIRRMDKI